MIIDQRMRSLQAHEEIKCRKEEVRAFGANTTNKGLFEGEKKIGMEEAKGVEDVEMDMEQEKDKEVVTILLTKKKATKIQIERQGVEKEIIQGDKK